MKRAHVLIVEDHPLMAELAQRNLEARGHHVAHVAGTLIEALAYLALAADGHPDVEDVHVVLTDGNTERGRYDGADGELIASFVHEKLPGVVVVGWSLDGQVRGADCNIPKHDMPGLGQFIMDLPEPEEQLAD